MPHVGDCYSQCADRFAIGKNTHRFAIADGVGASFFPEVWAELVSKDFIEHCDRFEENTILLREQSLISSWNDIVKKKISNLTDEEIFLIEMSKERCDFAACTFVGLSVDNTKWHCKALGDSYLFVLDKECNLIHSVASQKGHDFDNFPEYFASVHGKNNGMIVQDYGDISEIAYFVLLTDAISDWFIKTDTDKRKELVNVEDIQSFRTLVDNERARGEIKDDDTTAVIIRVIHDNNDNISIEELYNTDINLLIEDEETNIAKQETERLIKETEEKKRQEQSQQVEDVHPNDALTTSETPPIESKFERVEIKTQTNDKDALLTEKLTFFINNTQKEIESIVRDIESNQRRHKKEWNKIKHLLSNKMKGVIKDVYNKLNKMQG